MSEEGDKKLYAHYTALIGGSMKSGNAVRDKLIVADAKKHLADLIKKRPNVNFDEKVAEKAPMEQPEASEKAYESKSKVKK